ncbi:MAG: hypothetical protein LBS43_05470 [Prevotellaceae bacterium]|jgi:hypothetical protein|nr:hypothetical protein [Prevotellaceae bacterium]
MEMKKAYRIDNRDFDCGDIIKPQNDYIGDYNKVEDLFKNNEKIIK